MNLRERLIQAVEAQPSTVHPGSPRAISSYVCHAEVPDAVDVILDVLGIDGSRRADAFDDIEYQWHDTLTERP